MTGKWSVGSEARIGVPAARGSQDHADGHVQYVFMPTRGLYSPRLCVWFLLDWDRGTLFTQQHGGVHRTTEAFVCFLRRTHAGLVDSLARQVAARTAATRHPPRGSGMRRDWTWAWRGHVVTLA